MTSRFLRNEVTEAAAALREAQISLSVAIQQAYPTGTEVIAKIGKSKVTVRVAAYGANWSSPGELIGDNVATGKSRRFHHTAILRAVDDE